MNTTTRKLRTSRQPVDYVSLNDGYDEEEEPQPRKKWHKESYRPRSALTASTPCRKITSFYLKRACQ